MSYYTNAKEIEGKIGKVLAKEGLVYTFKTSQYPITLIISQSQSPAAQMSFMETGDNGVSSKDAALRFIFELDGLKIHTSSRLIITDELMSKLKGLAKKLHTAYVHAYFADHIDYFETPPCDTDSEDTEDTEQPEDDTPEGEDVPENGDSVPENEDPVTEDPTGDPFADFMNEPAAPEGE